MENWNNQKKSQALCKQTDQLSNTYKIHMKHFHLKFTWYSCETYMECMLKSHEIHVCEQHFNAIDVKCQLALPKYYKLYMVKVTNKYYNCFNQSEHILEVFKKDFLHHLDQQESLTIKNDHLHSFSELS